MTNTVHCSCGKAIQVPAKLTHRKARCPACGAIVRLDGVGSSDLELDSSPIKPAATEHRACDGCGKRFPAEKLHDEDGEALCGRCVGLREDARRHRVGMVVKAIAAVVVIVAGFVVYKGWIEPALQKGPPDPFAANPPKPVPPKADVPAPPVTPVAPPTVDPAPQPPVAAPAAPIGQPLSKYGGAQLLAVAPKANRIVLFRQSTRRPPAHELRVFDMAADQMLAKADGPYQVDVMAMSADGRRLMTVGRTGAQAETRLWDAATLKVIVAVPVLESFGRVGVASDGSVGWCLCPQEGIRIIDDATAEVALFKGTHVGSAYALFDPLRKLAAVKCNYEGGAQWIDFFDLDKRAHVHKFDPRERFGSFALSPDGSLLAMGFAGRIDLYETKNWSRQSQVKRDAMKNAPERLMFTADNQRIVEMPFGADGKGPIVREIASGQSRVLDVGSCLDFAAGEGDELFVLDEGHEVKRFDVRTGKVR